MNKHKQHTSGNNFKRKHRPAGAKRRGNYIVASEKIREQDEAELNEEIRRYGK